MDMIDCLQRSCREIMEIRQGGGREKGIHCYAFLHSSNLKAIRYQTSKQISTPSVGRGEVESQMSYK